jgi:histo-blood group ABO system transferase
MFKSIEQDLENYDYVFYSDVDMLFVDQVGEEILGPGLTATIHPGFYNKPREEFTYETNPQSYAYIHPDQGRFYFAGGFQGGTSKAFLTAVRECSSGVTADLTNNIIAVWQDESHWNRYLTDYKGPLVKLSPSYCFPESWDHLPFKKRLLALDKNHKEYRKE